MSKEVLKSETPVLGTAILAQVLATKLSEPHSVDHAFSTVAERRQSHDYNSATVLSGLFALTESALIYGIKTTDLIHGSAGGNKLLLTLAYAGLAFNSSTTFSGLLLLDRPTLTSRRLPPPVTEGSLQPGHWTLGRRGLSERAWKLLEYHFFTSFVAGSFVVLFEIFLCVFLQAGLFVAIATAIVPPSQDRC
ncbi:hypothetical protein FRB96_008539 [Tulasnella sp. 330]|nr:hypothetical protein FRB96_008539 [Tulasnella sp. 330]KAG8884682.1 hypothetical protein FRB98_002249 [Tulasnella sp. 332]